MVPLAENAKGLGQNKLYKKLQEKIQWIKLDSDLYFYAWLISGFFIMPLVEGQNHLH